MIVKVTGVDPITGGRPERTVTLSGDFTVGREGADLVLDDEFVSARHARFFHLGDGMVVVEDLGSEGGTWLWPGGRLTGPYRVAAGDKIRVGHTVLTIVET